MVATFDELGEMEKLRPRWGWYLALGIVLVLLGTVALVVPWLTTLTSVVVYGWLLLLGGAFEVGATFWTKGWRGILLHLLGGILSMVVGALIVAHPGASTLALTLVLATLFLVGGLSRIGAAIVLRYPSWGWAVASGVVTVALGVLVWTEWPLSALWLIGTVVAIELVCRGWAWVMFAFAAKRMA